MRTKPDFKATDFLRQSAEPLGPPPRMGVRLSPVFRILHRRRRRGPACAQGRLGQEAADAALGMASQPARKRVLRGGARVSADKRRSPPAGTSAGFGYPKSLDAWPRPAWSGLRPPSPGNTTGDGLAATATSPGALSSPQACSSALLESRSRRRHRSLHPACQNCRPAAGAFASVGSSDHLDRCGDRD